MLSVYSCSQTAAQITFEKTFGGPSSDEGYSVQQTNDNGYIIVGTTMSFGIGGDIYLIKTDENGDNLWTKTYGENYYDIGYSIQQTVDGGYIIGGFKGVFDPYSDGLGDIFIIKTDSLGNTLWTKTWGDSLGDYAYSIKQTLDKGYIVTGVNNAIIISGGNPTAYLTKLDSSGNILWTKTYDYSAGFSVLQTYDGGYILTGTNNKVYLIRTNSIGDSIWTKTINSNLFYGRGYSIIQAIDSNFVITGQIYEPGGENELFLCKVDINGNVIWSKSYGGSNYEWGRSVYQCNDNGYIIVGTTHSFGNSASSIWILRTDENGDTLWTKTYGNISDNEGYSGQQCDDKGFVLTGYSYYNNVSREIVLIKTDSLGNTQTIISENEELYDIPSITISPNPFVDYTIIKYKLPFYLSQGEIVIYNIQGYVIYRYKIKSVKKGQIKITNDKLIPGIYFCELRGNLTIFKVIKLGSVI
ncbi:MAG: T9SS type A sorting domain-containing protein [Bacteroidia bacterium]|nr:T9SS type A sorting domain-containing protein [Bacteroidia bacterium]